MIAYVLRYSQYGPHRPETWDESSCGLADVCLAMPIQTRGSQHVFPHLRTLGTYVRWQSLLRVYLLRYYVRWQRGSSIVHPSC